MAANWQQKQGFPCIKMLLPIFGNKAGPQGRGHRADRWCVTFPLVCNVSEYHPDGASSAVAPGEPITGVGVALAGRLDRRDNRFGVTVRTVKNCCGVDRVVVGVAVLVWVALVLTISRPSLVMVVTVGRRGGRDAGDVAVDVAVDGVVVDFGVVVGVVVVGVLISPRTRYPDTPDPRPRARPRLPLGPPRSARAGVGVCSVSDMPPPLFWGPWALLVV